MAESKLIASLKLIQAYLNLGRKSDLKKAGIQLSLYLKNRQNREHFSKKKLSVYPKNVMLELEKILTLLQTKNTSIINTASYSQRDFTDFFLLLCRQTNDPSIIQVTSLIEKKQRPSKWLLLIPAFLVTSPLAVVLATTSLWRMIKSTAKILAKSAKAVPIVGLIFSNLVVIYQLITNLIDKKKKRSHRIWGSLFLLSKSALNSLGYGLLLSGTKLIPWVGVLLILGSLTGALCQLFFLVKKIRQLTKFERNLIQSNSIIERRHEMRMMNGLKKQRNLLVNELITASLLLGLVVASNLLPGSPIVFAACISTMAIIYTVNFLAEKMIKKRAETQLQKCLSEVEEPEDGGAVMVINADQQALSAQSKSSSNQFTAVHQGSRKPFFSTQCISSVKKKESIANSTPNHVIT